jgi:phosphoesterase RecJ-like protein
MYPEADQIKQILETSQKIVVLQADNPDGDSLASALALEQILGDMGKDVYLYCGMDMPAHLHYLTGWDRVNKDLPSQFDTSIIVDTSADSLFEILNNSGQKGWLASKPCIVIDHHMTEATVNFAEVMCIKPAVATGEVIYELAKQLEWPLNSEAKNMVAISILSDSLGLMSEGTSARSIHIIGELVEAGVQLAELENRRRELMRKTPDILQYKAKLIERIEYSPDGRVATVTIPWEEIEKYSHEYNPSILVLDEMRLVTGVDLGIAFKVYRDGKITAKIRCNYGKAIGRELAEHFGGGGHPYASGFKIQNGRPLNEVKSECIEFATQLLNNLDKGHSDATLQQPE